MTDQIRLKVHVKAGSKESKLIVENDVLILYISAPATKGKANKAILEYLSKHFAVSKHQISLISGLKSKTKTILLEDLDEDQKTRIFSMI